MNTRPSLSTAAAILLVAAAPADAGTFSVLPWTGDNDSGLSSLTNYTAVVDFAGDGTRVINGVPFVNTSNLGTGTSSYQLASVPLTFTGFDAALGGSSDLIVSDFFHSGGVNDGNAYLTLGNLVPGQNYVTTWYNVGFGSAGGRNVTITPGDTSTPFTYDANMSGPGNGHRLTYSFTAVTSRITFAFDAASNNDSYHHYALTNAGLSGSAGPLTVVTPTYDAQSGPGPFAPYTPLSNDLLQTKVSSVTPLTPGSFSEENSGGIPTLTNGAFSISGGTNPELATGFSDSSVVFALDLTGAPQGYDISRVIGYGGWNDVGRDRQLFEVYYSVIGDSGFTLMGTADFNPSNVNGVSAVRSTFDTALSFVDAIRIDFPGGQENGYAGYGEFDVVGVASVPEPVTAGLLLVGMATLSMRRRSRS